MSKDENQEIPIGKPSWEERYATTGIEELPWYFEKLDPDLEKALKEHEIKHTGTFLDMGTGPATQAIELARLGFDVTGIDISHTAIKKAIEFAGREKLKIRFIQDDILDSKLSGKFDNILDRGVFHTFEKDLREKYIGIIGNLMIKGSYYFLKCFSVKELEHTEGPKRFSPEDIQHYFSKDFEILSVRDSIYHSANNNHSKTLFCVMLKR